MKTTISDLPYVTVLILNHLLISRRIQALMKKPVIMITKDVNSMD
jgi:hypothetical protein